MEEEVKKVLKFRDLVNAQGSLQKLSQIQDKMLTGKIVTRISRLLKKLEPAMKAYSDGNLSIFRKYGEFNKQTGRYNGRPEFAEEIQKERDDLLDEPLNVSFEKVEIPLLDNSGLNAADYVVLDDVFITVKEPEEKKEEKK